MARPTSSLFTSRSRAPTATKESDLFGLLEDEFKSPGEATREYYRDTAYPHRTIVTIPMTVAIHQNTPLHDLLMAHGIQSRGCDALGPNDYITRIDVNQTMGNYRGSQVPVVGVGFRVNQPDSQGLTRGMSLREQYRQHETAEGVDRLISKTPSLAKTLAVTVMSRRFIERRAAKDVSALRSENNRTTTMVIPAEGLLERLIEDIEDWTALHKHWRISFGNNNIVFHSNPHGNGTPAMTWDFRCK